MYLKQDKWITILRCIISCVLLTIGVMCLTYMFSYIDSIQWYWLGLCLSGGIIGIFGAIVNLILLAE